MTGQLHVGVDLVSVSRVKEFLKRHSKKRAERLLCAAERKKFSGRRLSPKTFAKIFAAKEAFFKTLNLPWLGVEGFSGMQIEILTRDRFRARTLPAFKLFPQNVEACGTFFSAGRLVGAQMIRWEFS